MTTSLMLFACSILFILAIVLPSYRNTPSIHRIAIIVLLHTVAYLLYVIYIQPIGYGAGVFDVLFQVLLTSLVPITPSEDKPKRELTKEDKSQLTLSDELKQIVVGLLLGDLYAQKPKGAVNILLRFRQGEIHNPQFWSGPSQSSGRRSIALSAT